MIEKILFITLSNFGDVILTLPVLDVLRANYPDARITVMVGPRAAEIFQDNPHIHNLIIYDKYAPLKEKVRLFFRLKEEKFDLVVDLRNTLFGALLPVKFRTSPFLSMPAHIRHMKNRNLYRLRAALKYKDLEKPAKERIIYVNQEVKNYINGLLEKNGITSQDKIIIISPAAGGYTRRWEEGRFARICQNLSKNYPVILIGREEDSPLTASIQGSCLERVYDFSGLTNLAGLAFLLQRASLVVSCDTGILHLASYLDIPIVALFGPSDEQRYGPWSSRFRVVKAAIPCRPCRQPNCRFQTIRCMQSIGVDEVLDSIDALMKL